MSSLNSHMGYGDGREEEVGMDDASITVTLEDLAVLKMIDEGNPFPYFWEKEKESKPKPPPHGKNNPD